MAGAACSLFASISTQQGSGHLRRLQEIPRKKQIDGCVRVAPFRPLSFPDSRKGTPGRMLRRYSFFCRRLLLDPAEPLSAAWQLLMA